MSEHEEKNAMLYLLAGVGIGAIIGAAAGLLFAPKAGSETRAELGEKFKELFFANCKDEAIADYVKTLLA